MPTFTYDGEKYIADTLPLAEEMPSVCGRIFNDYCAGDESTIGLILAWSEISPANQAFLDFSSTSTIGRWAMGEFYSVISKNNLPRLTNLLRAGLHRLAHDDRDGLSPVILAATAKTPACLQALLAEGADPNSTDEMGYTALRHAADRGLDHNIEVLLRYKADPDICDRSGVTPLHSLAMADLQDEHITSVRLLVAGGARLNIKFRGEKTALTMALQYGNILTAQALGFRLSP
jgi:ankyrin repeat protein